MSNIKLYRNKKKDHDLVEELVIETFGKNHPFEKLSDGYKENHMLPCLRTHDGIKELNFVSKVDGKAVGLVMSYLSTNIFYSLLIKK